jgi:outer membrane protein assembly factor BamB/predicted small secreted protein
MFAAVRWKVACMSLVCLVLLASAMLTAGCGGKTQEGAGEQGKADNGGKDGRAALAWPTPYQNAGRIGRSGSAGPQSSDLKWTYEAGAQSKSWAVLAADGSVLAGFTGKLVCLDASSGAVKWEFSTGSETPTTCGVGADGSIFFGAGNKLFCLTAQGSQRWAYDLGTAPDEPTVAKDSVYVGSTGGKLAALDLEGRLKWETQVGGDIRSPSLDRQGNLYCGASSFTLYAFDAGGKKLWEVRAAGDAVLGESLYDWGNTLDTPSIGPDGTIYAGSMTGPLKGSGGAPELPSGELAQGKLYAISPQGQVKWSYAYPGSGGSGYYSIIHSPSIGQDSTLYCGTSLNRVLALNPQGQLIWEYNTGEGSGVCPSVFSPSIGRDGLLYAATTSSKMICIDAQGKEKWRFDSGSPWLPDRNSNTMTPPPLGEDGTLFSVLAQGKVCAWPGKGR